MSFCDCRWNIGSFKKECYPWGQVFLQWWPCHEVWACSWLDHMMKSVCLAANHLLLGMSLADSLARCHGSQYFSTKPSPCAVPKWYWRERCREACRDTQTSVRLASHLVRVEDVSLNLLCGANLMHWLKVERPLGAGLFYNALTSFSSLTL